MSTCKLTFYCETHLEDSKNIVIDDIEDYLGGFSSQNKLDINNFQYQRFELYKKIKVDMSQDITTNKIPMVKYDYLRIETTVDNASCIYYYFILKSTQKAENTVEFELKMDTINTYKYVDYETNKGYTLSQKTLVHREHKDRFKVLNNIYEPRDISVEEAFALSEISNYNQYNNTSDETTILVINTSGIVDYMNSISLTHLEVFYQVDYGAYIEHKTDKYENVYYIKFGIVNNSILQVGLYDQNDVLIENLASTSMFIDDFVVVIPSGGYFDCYFKTNVPPPADFILYTTKAFLQSTSVDIRIGTLARIIDQYQEGFSTYLFKKSEYTLYDEDGRDNQWYVLYTSQNAVSSSVDYAEKVINPVQVRFYSQKGYTISTTSSVEKTLNANSPLIPKWVNSPETMSYEQANASTLGDVYVKVAGTTYDFHDYKSIRFEREGNDSLVFRYVQIIDRNSAITNLYNVESITFYGINTLSVFGYWGLSAQISINSGESSYTGTASKWEDLDLTDSKFIKAFAFPYCPCDFMVGQTSFSILPTAFTFNADNFIQLNNTQKYDFFYQKKFSIFSPLLNIRLTSFNFEKQQDRDMKYESKLYHSDYYQPKFVYDSFSFSFNLELVDVDEVLTSYPKIGDEFYVSYVVSKNVQSKFAFIFDEYMLKMSTQDYDNVLTVERNNEKALYNNSYINYIKSGGYSYDTKKASSQNAVNGITTALSIVGAAASFGGAVASQNPMLAVAGIGLATSSATSIVRGIHTAQEQDKAINQKINQNVMQGTSVQGSEDIDILTAISGNKAKLVFYGLSDIMKSSMWDLFHYCGYATNEQKIPNVNTRLYFNFVQADIVFDDVYINDENITNDIKNKWKEGITFFHRVDGHYDRNQHFENFEVSLMS